MTKGIGGIGSIGNITDSMDSNRELSRRWFARAWGKAQALIEQLGSPLTGLITGLSEQKSWVGIIWRPGERRLAVLRNVGSAPLPGHALVILDPALMLAIDVFACEDGHTQERALLSRGTGYGDEL